MTQKEIIEILKQINFSLFTHKFWFNVMDKGDGFLIQLSTRTINNETKDIDIQKGGKYYISSHAIKDEIVMTAWKACQDFVLHEARETFTYKGQTIFQPHYSVDQLAEFCNNTTPVKRPKNMIGDHLKEIEIQQDIDF